MLGYVEFLLETSLQLVLGYGPFWPAPSQDGVGAFHAYLGIPFYLPAFRRLSLLGFGLGAKVRA